LSTIKHLIQTEIFKFISTVEKINFVETHVKKQVKSQTKTSNNTKIESKSTKKTKAP